VAPPMGLEVVVLVGAIRKLPRHCSPRHHLPWQGFDAMQVIGHH